MALTTEQQAIDAIRRSSAPLIITRRDWTVDGIATSLALARLMTLMGKRVETVCAGFAAAGRLAFLPGADLVRTELSRLRQFVISLDVLRSPLDELFYEVKGGRLDIRVTPKYGAYAAADVSTGDMPYRHDLVVCVDTPDLPSLGAPFIAHPEFFRGVPTVAIAADPGYERYATMHAVDVTCASAAEALHGLIASTGDQVIDADVATCLLAGMIAATQSFRSPTVTPKTLNIAASLVGAGARREEIVRELYRTRSVATLKLWGRALARLTHDPETRTAWTALTRQDFVHAGADETDLRDIVGELMSTTPDADVCVLIHERHDGTPGIRAVIACDTRAVSSLVAGLHPVAEDGMTVVSFEGNDIVSAERTVLAAIRTALGRQRQRP